jgi:ABC-type proline/glycine betaine transport system permease subunit
MKVGMLEGFKAGWKDYNKIRPEQNLNRLALSATGNQLASIAYTAAARGRAFFSIKIPRAARRMSNGIYQYVKALWKVKKLDKPVKRNGQLQSFVWKFIKWITANVSAAVKMVGKNIKSAVKTSNKTANKYFPKVKGNTTSKIINTGAKVAGTGVILGGATSIGVLLGGAID